MSSEENYFQRGKVPDFDMQLKGAIKSQYVAAGCLRVGMFVLADVQAGRDPCTGCTCPREMCGGRTGIVGEDKRFKPTTPVTQKWMGGTDKEKAAKYDAIVRSIMALEKEVVKGPLKAFAAAINFVKDVEAIATGSVGGVERWEVDVYGI
jgi:hypothetical protein